MSTACPNASSDFRVLVAEDNPVSSEVIVSMLELLGAQAEVVENGQEAVNALANGSFDLVLMNSHMPVMDGLSAARAIRRHEEEQQHEHRVPIVALATDAAKEDLSLALEAGMDALVAKPFSFTEVREVTESLAPAHREKAPTFDAEALASLNEMETLGSTGLVARVLTSFLKTAATHVASLARASADKNRAGLRHAARTLHSSSSLVGAERLAQLCRQIEKSASQAGWNELAALVDQTPTEALSAYSIVQHHMRERPVA